MSQMKAVITAGGLGSRLRPITDDLPKPLVPVCGEPCIVRTVNLLLQYGIKDIAVTVMYKADEIEKCLEKYFPDLKFVFSEEKTPLGTAGSVGALRDFLDTDFIVISGDCVCDLNIAEAVNFHKQKNGIATVILAEREDPTEYGEVLTENGRVLEFKEKPCWADVFTSDVNTGIYIFKKDILDFIPSATFDFSKDLFPILLSKNIPIYAEKADFYWEDIGSPEKLLAANSALVGSKKYHIGKNCKVGNAEISGSVIGNDCTIGDGARIENSVLFDGVTVCRGSFLRGCILCNGVFIGENVSVGEESVIGKNCRIGDGTVVASGTSVFGKCVIPANSRLSGKVDGTPVTRLVRGEIVGFSGACDALSWGRAFGNTVGGNIAFAVPKKNYGVTAQAMTSGIRDGGANVYFLPSTGLSELKYTVRNFGFQGGVFFDGRAVFVDEDGLLISADKTRKMTLLFESKNFVTGCDGKLKIFNGFSTAYGHHLSHLFGEKICDFPVFHTAQGEKIVVSDEKLSVFSAAGEELDSKLLCFYVFGKRRKKVFIPDSFPSVAESVAAKNGFGIRRISFSSPDRYLLFNFCDPVFCAAELLAFSEEENTPFVEMLSSFPVCYSVSRRFDVSGGKASIISELSGLSGAKRRGGVVKISLPDRKVSVFPSADRFGFKVVAEAASAETASALCEFYVNKIKNRGEKVKNDTTE